MPHSITRYDFSPKDIERFGFKLYQLKANPLQCNNLPHFPEQTSIPHAHNFYEICIFLEAKGTHDIDFTPYPINSNAVHIIAPDSVHLIKATETSEGFIVAFSATFYEAFAYKEQSLAKFAFHDFQHNTPVVNLDAASANYIKNWLQNLIYDYTSAHTLSMSLFWSHLNLLLCHIHSIYKSSQPAILPIQSPKGNLLEKFKHLVELHYAENHQVQDYAKLLYVSPGQLNRVVKKMSGNTAINFIQDRIILEAKRLLSFSDMNNQEIAFQLRFSDPSYFTKIFKRKTTMTPNEFRAMMRSN
jgi:AraC-like DNA-binding protein